MARRITGTTLVRQASAEYFPKAVPTGQNPRQRNLTDPARSNIDLWGFWASVPEVRAIADRIQSGVERVNFRPCLNVEGATGDKCPPLIEADGTITEGVTPRFAQDCAEIWAQVRSPSGPQSDIFGAIATSLTVTGDAWQFGYPGTREMRWDPAGDPMWVGLARQALQERSTELGRTYIVEVGIDGAVKVPASPDVDGHGTAIRIWAGNPNFLAQGSVWLTSCVRTIQILQGLYEAAAACALSRTNAGFIVAPDDQDQLPVPSAAQLGDGQTTLAPLGTPLTQTLYNEIADDVEASSQVLDGISRATPSVIGVNSTIADKIRWVEIARQIDPQLGDRIDDCRHRIYQACPLPPEIAEGMANLSGLGGGNVADQIDKSEYQRAILPVCERIAWANSEYVLREGLVARGYSVQEASRVQIGFSAKNLLMPPDTSDAAIRLAALPPTSTTLNPSQIRDAAGLGDYDEPDDDDVYRATVLWLCSQSPEYKGLLPSIGIDLPEDPEPMADPEPVVEPDPEPEVDTRQASADGLDRTTGYRLMAVATRYEEKLATLTEAIIAQLTRRASSRVASLARSSRWADLRPTVQAATRPEMVGAVPGVLANLAAEGVDDGDLFEPALATFAPQFEKLTRRHQQAAVRELGGDWDNLEADADESNGAAWALLGTLLIAEARRRFEGVLPDETPGEGALSPFGIPAAIITRTSAVAGGQIDAVAGGANGVTAAVPWQTIATGPLSERAAAQASKVVAGYIWDYRPDLERNSFPPHEDLHGVSSDNEDDFDGFYVGDHAGCLCGTVPVYIDVAL